MAVDRDKVLQAAQKLVERKRYDKAIVEYQKLTAEDPKDVRTLLKIGDLYLKMEAYEDAITTYERVGEFYSQQGFALKAIAVYKQIREIIHKHVPRLEDRFGHVVPRLAEIYAQLGLTSDALAAYDDVAARLQRAGRDRDAIDVFRKIVDLEPNNPLPYLRLAEALVRVRDYDNAIRRFGTAAELLLKLGRRDDALKVVERLLQHRTDARFARMAAEIYLDRGDPSDGMAALAKLQISFKENPKDLETLTLLARAFDLLNQPAKAIEVQKESARIAKEAGRVDQFAAIVTSLLARAPDDEGVRQLAAQLVPSSTVDPRASMSIEVEIEEEVEVEAEEPPDDEPQSAVPIPLRQSQAALDPYDPAALARQIIGQAEGLRRAGQYDKAVAVLKSGIDRLPAARDIREKIYDVLIEAGDQDGAIEQMLAFAAHLSSEGDVEAAARVLDEVLLLEPDHAGATEMLAALGYAVPQDGYEQPPPAAPSVDHVYTTGELQAAEMYDPNAPLPSYQLDEVDDPFTSEAPLPSFEIEDEATKYMPPALGAPSSPPQPSAPRPPYRPTPAPMQAVAAPPALPVAPRQQPPARVEPARVEPARVEPARPQPYAPSAGAPRLGAEPRPAAPRAVDNRGSGSPSAPRPSTRAVELDEDALEEVEFFAQQSMFDEARSLLEEQLTRLPNHPLLLERLREVEALAAQARVAADHKSGTRVVPRQDDYISEDRAYDIAAALDSIDNLELAPDAQAPAAMGDDQQVSVEDVFKQFKAGVAAQISPSDAATHYDLGLAYKEMALYPDAISEFELASRDPGRECVCQSMIGVIHLQMGNIEGAIDAFIRGLHASQKTVEQELALLYEIASAYEMRGVPDQALYYFQRVARLSPSYNDPRGTVADRIRRLEVPKPAARAVGAEMLGGDDFDAAFDDLLSGAKLP
ncbi:MAG: tetratricopeptide repeat protein [Polyangiaceae bacterium]|nr:tetratricopeptide repeat protein [Polyangiaceae bacterium]